MEISTIVSLKRSMVIGSKWHTMHQFTGSEKITDMGVRTCGLNNSVDFGFINPESGNISHSQWPKKAELVPIDGGFKIVKDFVTLTYTHIEG